jgi:hypothetical protein
MAKVEKKFKAVLVLPESAPEVVDIDGSLDGFVGHVGGYCHEVKLFDNVFMIVRECDTEAQVQALPYNRKVGTIDIRGPILITRTNLKNGSTLSLTEKHIAALVKAFSAEVITSI